MTVETVASKENSQMKNGEKETLMGAFVLAWAAICGIYGAIPLASFCLVLGVMFFLRRIRADDSASGSHCSVVEETLLTRHEQ